MHLKMFVWVIPSGSTEKETVADSTLIKQYIGCASFQWACLIFRQTKTHAIRMILKILQSHKYSTHEGFNFEIKSHKQMRSSSRGFTTFCVERFESRSGSAGCYLEVPLTMNGSLPRLYCLSLYV